MKKHKVIIDTDIGVDDATSVIVSLFDENLDIKLFSVPPGNVSVDIGTRNICHILDLFKKDVPVVKGPKTAMMRISPDATFLHGKDGLGGYLPPKTTVHQPLKEDFVEVMYRVIKENPKEITILALGPHTNIGHLIQKHPDCKKLIKQIIFEGAAPFGLPNNPKYISFNARTDPEALKIVLESKIPVVMVPSNMGRFVVHLTEKDVNELGKMNDIGKFLHKTFEIYWEPDAPDKRIATNDSCATFYLKKPSMYKTKKCIVHVNVTDKPGDLKVEFTNKGHVKLVRDINRKKFIKVFFDRIKKLNDVKLDDSIYDRTNSNAKQISERDRKIQEKKKNNKKTATKTQKNQEKVKKVAKKPANKTSSSKKTASKNTTNASKKSATKTTNKKTTKTNSNKGKATTVKANANKNKSTALKNTTAKTNSSKSNAKTKKVATKSTKKSK